MLEGEKRRILTEIPSQRDRLMGKKKMGKGRGWEEELAGGQWTRMGLNHVTHAAPGLRPVTISRLLDACMETRGSDTCLKEVTRSKEENL